MSKWGIILMLLNPFTAFAIGFECYVARSHYDVKETIFRWRENGKDQQFIYKSFDGESFGVSVTHEGKMRFRIQVTDLSEELIAFDATVLRVSPEGYSASILYLPSWWFECEMVHNYFW